MKIPKLDRDLKRCFNHWKEDEWHYLSDNIFPGLVDRLWLLGFFDKKHDGKVYQYRRKTQKEIIEHYQGINKRSEPDEEDEDDGLAPEQERKVNSEK
jgi:hypothetical protein